MTADYGFGRTARKLGIPKDEIRHLDFDPAAKVGDYLFASNSVIVADLGYHLEDDGELGRSRPYHLVRVRRATEAECVEAHATYAARRVTLAP